LRPAARAHERLADDGFRRSSTEASGGSRCDAVPARPQRLWHLRIGHDPAVTPSDAVQARLPYASRRSRRRLPTKDNHRKSSASGGNRWSSPGSRVPPSFSAIRVFANAQDGFAVPDLPQKGLGGPGSYPVMTSDGGRSWRTAGPVLHIPAAQGAIAVGQPGMVGARILFAWCGSCNSVIDTSSDAGRHWWQTFLPGQVLSVLADQAPATDWRPSSRDQPPTPTAAAHRCGPTSRPTEGAGSSATA
jgi:hypothetical protein